MKKQTQFKPNKAKNKPNNQSSACAIGIITNHFGGCQFLYHYRRLSFIIADNYYDFDKEF
jgi:hypothetical protein